MARPTPEGSGEAGERCAVQVTCTPTQARAGGHREHSARNGGGTSEAGNERDQKRVNIVSREMFWWERARESGDAKGAVKLGCQVGGTKWGWSGVSGRALVWSGGDRDVAQPDGRVRTMAVLTVVETAEAMEARDAVETVEMAGTVKLR